MKNTSKTQYGRLITVVVLLVLDIILAFYNLVAAFAILLLLFISVASLWFMGMITANRNKTLSQEEIAEIEMKEKISWMAG